MKTVALLPMDDRPVNYDYPRHLGRAAGLHVALPPREWLGNPWRASRHAELVGWLAAQAAQADAAIVAIDTLAYGGLIPSRKSTEPTDAVLARLEVLRKLKVARPELQLLASSVVLRICRSDSSEEEKPYWAVHGRRMFRLSYLEHKADVGDASAAEVAEQRALRAEVPAEVYDDYRRGRARNHAVNAAMLDWTADGVFDYLLLPQDDTADYGWNIAEARRLQARIRAVGLTDRAITYPGADEIGCLLLARYACRTAGFAPRVWPRYSGVTSPMVVTAYEDRPIHELLKAHLAPLGGIVADTPADSDLTLFCNAPVRTQGNGDSQWLLAQGLGPVRARLPAAFHDWFDAFVATEGFRGTRAEVESPARSPEEFTRALLAAIATGRPVALADVAYVNAADLALGNLLRRHPEIARLAAFGGWNTAGNTLGTVLAQAMIRVLALRGRPTADQTAAHLEFLFLRWVDDDLYQATERTRCMVEDLPAAGLAPTMERLPDAQAGPIEASVRRHLAEAAGPLRELFIRSGMVEEIGLENVHLPWQRLFEVGFSVHAKVAPPAG